MTFHTDMYKVIIIIIIVWLVQWWTLPFLQECSMLVGSVLDDRRLPDRYRAMPDQTQMSEAKCDAVSQMGGSSLLVEGPSWPWRLDCGPWMSAHVMWPRNLRQLVRITPVSSCWSVCYRTSSLEMRAHQGIQSMWHRPLVKCIQVSHKLLSRGPSFYTTKDDKGIKTQCTKWCKETDTGYCGSRRGWRRGIVVTELVVSTKLLYVEPG